MVPKTIAVMIDVVKTIGSVKKSFAGRTAQSVTNVRKSGMDDVST